LLNTRFEQGTDRRRGIVYLTRRCASTTYALFFSFATSTSCENAAASAMAISESILRLMTMPASFRPLIKRE